MGSKKKKVVAISGGFDPIHVGHVRMIREAKKLGDKLVVILNNDNWLKMKKGFAFMPEKERKEIIEAIECVDRVVLTKHKKNTKDYSVCDALRGVRPDIFANGGDRNKKNIPEMAVCEEIDCEMIFNVGRGGKIQSSSWLVENFIKRWLITRVIQRKRNMEKHKLTKDEIVKYARLYEERWPNDAVLERKFFKWFKKHRYLDKDTFVQLGRWKTKRQTKNYLRNSDEFIRLITRKALQEKDEKPKIETLMELYGISWAVASVILHFAFPGEYPILDFRAIWSLGFKQPKSYDFNFWQQYIRRFRELREETNLPARTIDRGLWMFSKLNQKV